jgi:hypothetical protein
VYKIPKEAVGILYLDDVETEIVDDARHGNPGIYFYGPVRAKGRHPHRDVSPSFKKSRLCTGDLPRDIRNLARLPEMFRHIVYNANYTSFSGVFFGYGCIQYESHFRENRKSSNDFKSFVDA